MAAVRVVQVTIDQVVHVARVRHRLMATAGAVLVTRRVGGAVVARGASLGVSGARLQLVALGVRPLRVVEVALVEVVGVPFVLDSDVSAAGAVLVTVVGMGMTAHLDHRMSDGPALGQTGPSPGEESPRLDVPGSLVRTRG